MRIVSLKRFLLVFWATWLTVVFLSNLADAAKPMGLLGESWAFASGNWKAIKETTARYGITDAVNSILFAGVIFWELLTASLFWRAAWIWRGQYSSRKAVHWAFMSSLGLWAAFLVVDEVLIAYAMEGSHLGLFTAHLATLLAIELLPED